MVKNIVKLIEERCERSLKKEKDRLPKPDIEAMVLAGIERLRVTEPCVKLVFKEISWESTRHHEFTEALSKVMPNKWFEVFIAARERGA